MSDRLEIGSPAVSNRAMAGGLVAVATHIFLTACAPSAVVEEVFIDMEPFREGCSTIGECVVVSKNACDFCQIVRDEPISRNAGGDYQAALQAAAEQCTNEPPGELCGSSRPSVEAACVDGRCIEDG
ncbi:MAG: hypothetical protein Q8O67_32185 [Deltaproteobacteria bacterium]|nr:hypothetical protein [Deltaproteobacteria bacterium]